MKQILFEQGTDRPRREHTRRVGKPRANWFVETCKDAFTTCDPNTNFGEQNTAQIKVSATKAKQTTAKLLSTRISLFVLTSSNMSSKSAVRRWHHLSN